MKLNFFKTKKRVESIRIKLIKELTYTHGYSMLRSSNTLPDNEILLNFAKQYDEYGYMSEELGRELDSLFENNDYIVGIHRTGYTDMTDEMISEIFNKGLINNGHIMQGGMDGSQDIEKTVSFFNNFPILNSQLKVAHGYKCSQGCIIVKIPRSYLGKSNGEIKPIYYKDGYVTKLLPEFIYGYVSVDKEGKLGEIKHNSKYSDIHNLNNVNLLYEDSVIYKVKREGIDLKNNGISVDDKYQIVKKAYQDTLIKYGKNQARYALLDLINNNGIQYFSGKENRGFLKKYIIYGDVLKILSLSDLTIHSKNQKNIIDNFFEICDVILEEKYKEM